MAHHGLQVEFGLGHRNAHIGEVMARFLEQIGGMQQSLGRNTTNIQAGATMALALFDNGGFQTELGCANSTDIAARTGTDDNQIIRHNKILPLSTKLAT